MVRPTIFLTLAMCFLAVFFSQTLAATEKDQRAALAQYTEAEKFVLEQVAAGNLADLSARFKGDVQKQELPANFIETLLISPKDAKVHRNGVQIAGARIVGPFNLANTEIQNFVYLADCEFDNVSFFQTVFQKGLTIDRSVFHKNANFSYATVHEGLSAVEAKFMNADGTANFDSIKVRGPFFLGGAMFAGPATFVYAVVDGSFSVTNAGFMCRDDAKPACAETTVSFNTMNVGRGFFAQGAHFQRPVDLINLRAEDNLEGEGAKFEKSAIFSMMSLGHNLFLSSATFGGDVFFNAAHVEGTVLINGTYFAPGHLPDMSGLTYQDIYPTKGLLEQIRNSSSDYSAYTQLENCLQRNGEASEADEVFIAKKKRERKSLKWGDTLRSYLSEYLQGFGRIPQRVLLYDLGFIALGAILFRRKKMTLKRPAPKASEENADAPAEYPPYNAFLYSLTLFAPAVDTQYTNNWQPAASHRKTRRYMTVQKWAGYIFVPLTIGIWTGIFK